VRIPVVKDDPAVRESIVETLRDEGHRVIHAKNGAEALADVLINDIRLPGRLERWRIAERYREHDPGLPIIDTNRLSLLRHRPVPGSVSLQKPFHPEAIVRTVKELARQGGSS
jgi:DNA-binding response OmpR family regulator